MLNRPELPINTPANSQMLGDFVFELYSDESLDKRFKLFEKYIQKLGFDSASYTLIPNIVLNGSIDISPIFLSSSLFSQSFIDQYIEDRFDHRDFTIRAIKDGHLYPMIWQESMHWDYLTDDEKHVLFLAKEEHGIKNGISLPVQGDQYGMAGFSVLSSANDHQFQYLKAERIGILNVYAKAFNNAISSNAGAPSMFTPNLLTNKEEAVLRYVLEGKTMADIGKSNEGISRRYAEKILLNLRKKFGGLTTHQLIAHVVRLGLL